MQEANMTEGSIRGRSSSFTDSEQPVLPPNILTASHLSSLRELLSDQTITGCAVFHFYHTCSLNSRHQNIIESCLLTAVRPSINCKCVSLFVSLCSCLSWPQMSRISRAKRKKQSWKKYFLSLVCSNSVSAVSPI